MRKGMLSRCGVAGVALLALVMSSSRVTQAADADRHPDLQGVWSFATLTPLERPAEFAGKAELTAEEAAEFVKRSLERSDKDRRDGGGAADVSRAYNDFWWDYGSSASRQTSLVVDPPDGRIPAMTESARLRATGYPRDDRNDNPEERGLAERCIIGFNSGPPMMPSAYNNNVQLVQSPGTVVIVNEMIHSARVVRLGGTHLPADMRILTGDSVGHWDGDTLVVDTTNFLKAGSVRGSSRDLHLVERFTRVNDKTLRYQFTVDDPTTWTQPWTVSMPMSLSEEPMYEYACHEGNHGLMGILKGGRFKDSESAR